jgi:uncharacterized protein (TIGR00369 family)
MDQIAQLQQMVGVMFTKNLDMKIVEATADRLIAETTVTDDMCTTGRMMHGGAVMTMADFLGAAGTFLNLPPGAGTTTLESKTNFIAGAESGTKVTAVCEPVHKGKSTQVWRTTVKREDGRTVAVVTQTQMVLQGNTSAPIEPMQLLTGLFQGKSLDEQKALLAQLERAGAALYQTFAAQETDDKKKKALLEAAQREDDNAVVLEEQA